MSATMTQREIKKGDRVRFRGENREGVVLARNSRYRQWLIEWDNHNPKRTWCWASDLEVVEAR